MLHHSRLIQVIPGFLLLLCAALSGALLLRFQAALGAPPPAQGMNPGAGMVNLHRAVQLSLLLITASGGLLALTLSAWLGSWSPGSSSQRPLALPLLIGLSGLLTLFCLLLFIFTQLQTYHDPFAPGRQLEPAVFTAASITLTLLFAGPLCVLNWVILWRTHRWVKAATLWAQQPGPSGSLQRTYARLSHALLAGVWGLVAIGLTLIPVQMIDRAPAIAIQTPLEQTLIAQQTPMTQIALLAAFASAAALWYWRLRAQDLTHALDPQHSRIAAAIRQGSD